MITIVTRLSRDAIYLERVLNGLKKQLHVKIVWVIVSQVKLEKAHLDCLDRAKNLGIEVVIIQASKGQSLGKLANLGVRAAKTEFVMLHDDDDELRCDFINTAIKLLQSNQYVAVAVQAAIIHETGTRKKLHLVLSPGNGIVDKEQLSNMNVIVTNGCIFRRDAFEDVGGYPENVKVAEDWMFYLKLVEQGEIGILSRICANVFIRQSFLKNSTEANSDSVEHRIMADKIRQRFGIENQGYDEDQANSKHRIRRLFDRLTYQAGGWLVPRK